MHRRADTSDAQVGACALNWLKEASEADMVANDNISAGRKTAETAREPRQHTELVVRRRGAVFFLANDNQRLADRDRGARGARRQDAKAFAVLRKIAELLRGLLKLERHAGDIDRDLGDGRSLQVQLVRLGGVGG